ncbi:MAG TPA: carbohydrate-binding domain-containing protein [Polyangiaceae bacterium]
MPNSIRALCCALTWTLGLSLNPSHAAAKPWKGAETITRETFKYGAFEGRVRSARGSGFSTPFFLWRDGSEQFVDHWQEQDFEMFGKNGGYQTQLMTPGRTEHNIFGWLPTAAWERYYTYRMEWTPNYLAFYIDGQLVRRETDREAYGKFLDTSRAEPAQLRVSIWAGDWEWSGAFDANVVPQAVFVNWIQTYRYTPGAGPNGSDFTPLWRDDFNTFDTGRWWQANWTFDLAVNDYVPQNATAKSGALVMVFTDANTTGRFPEVPPDDGLQMVLGPPVGHGPFAIPGRIEAEGFASKADSTPGNLGSTACGVGDVDLEITQDPNGGYCNVGWTTAGEWLEYDLTSATTDNLRVSLRAAANQAGKTVHVELDGSNVTGPLTVPANGWQAFSDVISANFPVAQGSHRARLVFDTGDVNVNYLEFLPGTTNQCSPTTHTYEAEDLAATVGARDADGWNLWGNGRSYVEHQFIGANAIVSVRAWGMLALGVPPHMVVSIGGQVIGEANVSASTYTAYDFFYAAAAGVKEISVAFDNDYYANDGDRNLSIDSITVEECPQ